MSGYSPVSVCEVIPIQLQKNTVVTTRILSVEGTSTLLADDLITCWLVSGPPSPLRSPRSTARASPPFSPPRPHDSTFRVADHAFAISGQVMRPILLNESRIKATAKRGAGPTRVDLETNFRTHLADIDTHARLV